MLDEEVIGGGAGTLSYGLGGTNNGEIKVVHKGDIVQSDGFYDAGGVLAGADMKGLVIGTSCTTIGSYAFNTCTGLTGDLVIPNSVTSIGFSAFGYSGLTGDLVIPNSVTTIGDYAFYVCSGLTGDLVIPNSVTSIGNYAFNGCSSVTALYTNTPAASWVGTNALSNTTALVNIYEGPDVTGQYSATFQGGSGMTVSAWTNYPNIP